ncbi:hypothetical protein [Elstera cyanobacteriorum]|uniref:hypothetical protein n=1 Tax=Elstera cyanobacteriorum TaxID=2022747 RepID=UPI00235681CB|nr:hypothetical protein [Elstera cyanobacteriorum]MCK6443909.1 hypothetical protein [Elstera cyanobacteriorum]
MKNNIAKYIFIAIISCTLMSAQAASPDQEDGKQAAQKRDDERNIQDWISAFYYYLNHGTFQEAIQEAERWIKRTEGIEDQHSRALYLKATALYVSNHYKDTIPVLDEIINLYITSNSEDALFIARKSMIDKAANLIAINKINDAITTYTSLLSYISESSEEKYKDMTARALYGQGLAYGIQGKSAEAIRFYFNIARRFQGTENPNIKITLSDTYLNLGSEMLNTGNSELAKTAWMTGIQELRMTNNMKILFNLSQMAIRLGRAQEKDREIEKAIFTYTEIVKIFSKIDAPAIQINVENAKQGLARLNQ